MKRLLCVLFLNVLFAASYLFAQDYVTIRQLTSGPEREGFPSWAHDGKTIVYTFVDVIDGKPRFGSRKIPADGGEPIQFTDYATEHPKWSPDGRWIVFDADTGASINIIDAKGGSPKKFLPDEIRIHKGGLPCWSPSGTHIAFTDSAGSLWVYGLETGVAARVFQQEGFVALPGCWSRDGHGVLVALMDRKTRLSTVWKVSSDGSEQHQITGHRDSLYRYLALSPDGAFLAYAAMQGKKLGLWITLASPVGAAERKSLPLAVSDRYHNESPEWSPDGKRIAFASGRTGRGHIYVMELDLERIKKELSSPNE